MRWDAAAYDGDFHFVTDYGTGLLDLLTVEPPASVIDIGCGTGVHAATLADRGLDVVGVDVDPDMIARARESFPAVEFVVGDAQHLPTERLFDAAFSNAALHWMPDQAVALASIRSVLNPGAPFVAEMGGKNNVEVVDSALVHAVEALGLPTPHIRKFFPSLAQEAVLLAEAGFEVTAMQWFERPTPLSSEQAPADWTRLFRADVWSQVPVPRHGELARGINDRCEALRREEGWFIDYWRLRFVARVA